MKSEFSLYLNDYDSRGILPESIVNNYFYAFFDGSIEKENDTYAWFNVVGSIERDNYLNNYKFKLVINKEKNYYVLLNSEGMTVLGIEDTQDDQTVIEREIMNQILIEIQGFIPRFYFDQDNEVIYSKIHKYINNRLQKFKKYIHKEVYFCCGNNDYINQHIVYKLNMLLTKVYYKTFSYDGVDYYVKMFDNSIITDMIMNNTYKIRKNEIKIEKIVY